MRHAIRGFGLGLALALAASASAGATTVYDLSGDYDWTPNAVLPGAFVGVTDTNPRNGTGSLELSTTGSAARSGAIARLGFSGQDPIPFGTLGALVNGGAFTFDIFRDASSDTNVWLAPAAALHVSNGAGEQAVLIWEAAFNGFLGGFPEDVWVDDVAMTDQNFWQINIETGTMIEIRDLTLADWITGTVYTDGNGNSSIALAPDSPVNAVSIGAGSGWPNGFLGFADDLNLAFGGGSSYSYDFEVIPEPTTGLLVGAGLAALGIRRRGRTTRGG